MENTIFNILGLILALGLPLLATWGTQRLPARDDEHGGGELLQYLILFAAALAMIPLTASIRGMPGMLF